MLVNNNGAYNTPITLFRQETPRPELSLRTRGFSEKYYSFPVSSSKTFVTAILAPSFEDE